jgi:polyhydroxybutyrate depolymerase
MNALICSGLLVLAAGGTGQGDVTRTLQVDGRERSYLLHVPPSYDPEVPTPVVLALHGGGTNAEFMRSFSGLNAKSDQAGFLLAYPNGTGAGSRALVWNAGGVEGQGVDDVKFIAMLLEDLGTTHHVDPLRVFVTGHSNGGMMAYRLATDLADRIAAIAPVSGTMTDLEAFAPRPVSVIHFHGTADWIVPFFGPGFSVPDFLVFASVPESMHYWVTRNACPPRPEVENLPDTTDDGTTVRRWSWGPGLLDTEVVLYAIRRGGHTWPGVPFPLPFLGLTTLDISANDLMWEFFERHPLPDVESSSVPR